MNQGGLGPAGRVLGIDLGSRRIGVAMSDDRRRVATGLTVLARSGSHSGDHQSLAALVQEEGATLVVVGLPLSLSGATGPAAQAVQAEVHELRLALSVPVECSDERFTTVIAQSALAAAGRRPRARRAVVDKVAAAAILQTWLDRNRPCCWDDVSPAPAAGP